MNLEDFKKRYEPKDNSCIDSFFNDVELLINANYSQSKIIVYLKSKGVSTTQQNLSRWIKINLKNKEISTIKKDKNIDSKKSIKIESSHDAVDELDNFFGKKKR